MCRGVGWGGRARGGFTETRDRGAHRDCSEITLAVGLVKTTTASQMENLVFPECKLFDAVTLPPLTDFTGNGDVTSRDDPL